MPGPILPVILCGGGGTRLAPLSTPARPKQFLEFFQSSPRSLFQRTLVRLPAGPGILPPLVIGNVQYRDLINSQIGETDARVILEPVARNTAPAVAVAAHWARIHAPGATLVVLPSDHAIGDISAFQKDVFDARGFAEAGFIVVFGVAPDRLETGYGYIQPGARIEKNGATGYHVDAFVEKPDPATARRYLDDKTNFWNSGMFVFNAATMLAEFEQLAPDIANGAAAALQNAKALEPAMVLSMGEYEKLESISLDYAVMERTGVAALVRFSSPWRDLGTIEMLKSFSSSPASKTDPLSPNVQAFLDATG